MEVKSPNLSSLFKLAFFALIVYIGFKLSIFYYNKYNKPEYIILLDKDIELDNSYSKVIPREDIFPASINFSLLWKMKVRNIPSNYLWASSFSENKTIILNGGCPDIFYKPSDNNLEIRFELADTSGIPTYYSITYDEVLPQSWMSFAIIVETRYVSLYANNKLVKSVKLPSVPIKQKGPLRIGFTDNNFLGLIKDIQYYNRPLLLNEIQIIN
jgi:hypothetical protein